MGVAEAQEDRKRDYTDGSERAEQRSRAGSGGDQQDVRDEKRGQQKKPSEKGTEKIGGRRWPPTQSLAQFVSGRLERRLRRTVSVPPRSINPLKAKLGSTSGATLLVGLPPVGLLPGLLLVLWSECPKSQSMISWMKPPNPPFAKAML